MSDLVCVSFSAQAQGDADAVHAFVAPVGMMLVGVSGASGGVHGHADGVQHRRQRRRDGGREGPGGRHGGDGGRVEGAAPRRQQCGGVDCGRLRRCRSTSTSPAARRRPADYDIQLWLLPGTV